MADYEPIISVSGLRGVIGVSLTPDVVMRYAGAFAAELDAGTIVIGRDGRASGGIYAALLRGMLAAAGRDVVDAGVVATPTVGVIVRELGAAGGIQISASHNPREYNGLKLFSAQGRVMPAVEGQLVLQRYRSGEFRWAAHDRIGGATSLDDTTTAHWERIRDIVDAERIRRRKYKVLLDANHGAGSVLARILLAELGCDVTLLGGEPNGRFEHPPEPTAENLAGVCNAVVRAAADVGFCQDPDADRLAVIDAGGRYLGEEYTLAMCVEHTLATRPGPIVTNCSTSRMSEDIARNYGVPFHRSAVGEANVIDVMLAHDAVLGGEGNGGVIDPRVVLVRDSFVGMAMLLDAMAAAENTIAELADGLPRYFIHKTKIALAPARLPDAYAVLEKQFQGAATERLDGLRFDWPDAWLLVRPSNTEPIVRAIAEASEERRARALCDEAAKSIESL